MSLTILPYSPRILTVPTQASAVPPTKLGVEPFVGGNVVQAAGTTGGLLIGASVNKFTAGKYAAFRVTAADVGTATGVANQINQVAAAREADGDVSGDLTVVFGSAAGDIIDSIPTMTGADDSATALGLIVLVNGVPYGRIIDATSPNPAVVQFGADSDTNANFNIVIGASTGVDVIKVGSLIEVFIGLNIDECAERSAAGAYIAGTTLVTGIPEERYLGVIATVVDSAGRSTTQLVRSDFVMADDAPVSLTTVTK